MKCREGRLEICEKADIYVKEILRKDEMYYGHQQEIELLPCRLDNLERIGTI